jgi:AcrR family transcriptional regulator
VDADSEPTPDLRTRKKLATREALSRAALRLALERGLENVRVDDIAAAAGVSPRTYNNYFSSREEAICALGAERAHRIASAVRERPAGESLAEVILRAMLEEYAGPAEPEKATLCLVTSAPALRGEFLKTIAAIEAPLAEAIAERAGLDAALFPRVLAAAVAGAARVATEYWLCSATTAPFASVLREALTNVAPMASPAPKGSTC